MQALTKGTPKLGEILLKHTSLRPEQLEEALAAQKSSPSYLPLGEACVELRFLSRTDLNKALRKHRKRMALGELLVNLSLVTAEQVEEALKLQQRTGKKIGQILVDEGILTESSLVSALSLRQHKVRFETFDYAGHGFVRPHDKARLYQAVAEWLDAHL